MNTTPQQRNHPGESGRKCSPNRVEEKPLFANQVDPPPQRPWAATSDEGNTSPPPRPVAPAATDVSEPVCFPEQQPRD